MPLSGGGRADTSRCGWDGFGGKSCPRECQHLAGRSSALAEASQEGEAKWGSHWFPVPSSLQGTKSLPPSFKMGHFPNRRFTKTT